MRMLKSAAVLLGIAVVAIPAGAAIKAMTLAETMELHSDVLHGRIVAKTTVKTDLPLPDMVYTHMTVQGESLITGEKLTKELVFLGSHDPRDNYGTSEMPSLQDTRLGAEAIILYAHDASGAKPVDRVFDYSSVYRVETAFGSPVVIGKGEGFAFPENVKLSEARDRIVKTHAEIQAAKAKAGK
jgi:hypothetical protein